MLTFIEAVTSVTWAFRDASLSSWQRRAVSRSVFRVPHLPKVPLSIRARRCREARTGIPPRPGAGRIDGVGQGHRGEALRLRFSCRRSSRLAAEYVARYSRSARRTPRTSITGIDLVALERRARSPSRGGDRGRSRRQSAPACPDSLPATCSVPAGKTPTYMGQPLALLIFEQFDAFDQARLALRDGTSCVKFGEETGPVVMRRLRRLSLHPGGRRDAGRARCLFADPGRLGQCRAVSPELGDFRSGRRLDERIRRDLRQGRVSMASRSAPNSPRTIRRCWCSTANSKPSPSTRCFSSRKAGSAGTMPAPKLLSSCSACSRLTTPLKRLPICLATRGLLSSRRTSRPCLPIWAADSADAIIRPFRFYIALAAMFLPDRPVRLAHRPLSSSFKAASSVTPSRCARGSASIARPARSADSPPIMCWTAAASPIFQAPFRPSAPSQLSASTRFRKSISPRSRCIRAALPRDRCAVTARCKR